MVLFIYLGLLTILALTEGGNEQALISTFFDAFWYSIVTLTTVGYGDMYPITFIGKIIGLTFVVASLGAIGLFISSLSVEINKRLENRRIGFMGTNFQNHVVIIGWDKFAQRVLEQIILTGYKIAIVTDKKDEIDLIRTVYQTDNVFVLYSDINHLEALSKVNIRSAAKVFINFENDTDTLVYTLNLKNKFPGLNIIVSLNNSSLKGTFEAAGVTYAVSRDQILSKLVASYIFEPDVAAITEDIMSTATGDDDYDIQEFFITDDNPFINENCLTTFVEMKNKYDSILLAISKFDKTNTKLITNPGENIMIMPQDYLVILTNGTGKNKIQKDFQVKEGRL